MSSIGARRGVMSDNPSAIFLAMTTLTWKNEVYRVICNCDAIESLLDYSMFISDAMQFYFHQRKQKKPPLKKASLTSRIGHHHT